jgi:hypothetical protein
MLFCRTKPLPCKSGKTWAAVFSRRYRSLLALASVKSRYALPLRTRPPSFCLLSPEAVLLTGKSKAISHYINLPIVIASDSAATSSLYPAVSPAVLHLTMRFPDYI